jgi:HK97 family phage major capsid protein
MTPEEIQKGLEGVRDQTAETIKAYHEENAKLMHDFQAEQKAWREGIESKGYVDPETRERVEKMWKHMEEIDAKLSAPPGSSLDRRMERKSIGQMVTEHQGFRDWAGKGFTSHKSQRYAFDQPFFPAMEGKLISDAGLGSATTGVMPIQRIPGLLQLPRQELRIRDLLPVQPTTFATVDWLKQNVFTNAASPQNEGVAKAESTISYTTASTPVRTIAHFMQVTTQALADNAWLRADIDSELMYGLKLKEETEILSGDGLGVHISGLITQATAYADTYNAANDTYLDTLRHAILEARMALYPVTGIVLNPVDLQIIELIKSDEGTTANRGRYVMGDPRQVIDVPTIWGKPVVESDSIAVGHFLVGAFSLGATLFDRMTAVIDISFEHGTNFTENEATIRCEERLALAVKRPASFIYGAF